MEVFLGGFVTAVNIQGECWFESTSSNGHKWCRENSHLGRHCGQSLFLRGNCEQARTSPRLFLVRDPRSVFTLDKTKHI